MRFDAIGPADVRTVPCPACGAAPADPCRTGLDTPADRNHPDRFELYVAELSAADRAAWASRLDAERVSWAADRTVALAERAGPEVVATAIRQARLAIAAVRGTYRVAEGREPALPLPGGGTGGAGGAVPGEGEAPVAPGPADGPSA